MQLPQTITGGQALAYGAARAGVGCITAYPGSPSSATVATLIELLRGGEGAGCHLEWSANERVALEVAIGACLGGRRALVCTKSVGMNVMVDPLMALNLTPLSAGLVIILGDDPGAYGSQNDQDTRALADLIELPMVEPATPGAGEEMVAAAFAAAERYSLPVVVRVTRSFDTCQEYAGEAAGTQLAWQVRHGRVEREAFRYVPYPGNAVAKHRELHGRLQAAAAWVADASFNRSTAVPPPAGAAARPRGAAKSGAQPPAHRAPVVPVRAAGEDVRRLGIISAGFCTRKLADVIGAPLPDGAGPPVGGVADTAGADRAGAAPPAAVGLLELGGIFPLPADPLRAFLAAHEEVLVLEENEPYLEQRIAGLAHAHHLTTRVRGKLTGEVPRCGELYRWQIAAAVAGFAPELPVADRFTEATERAERPPRRNHCADCPFDQLIDAVQEWLKASGRDAWLVADPGCLAVEAPRLDAKYAIGSAVAVADGLLRAGQDAVALFGDSAFFHAALPALCNAYAHGANLAAIVADNDGSVTTGRQPHPGSGRSALGTTAPRLDMLALARACGARHASRVPLSELPAALPAALEGPGVRVLVVDAPCHQR